MDTIALWLLVVIQWALILRLFTLCTMNARSIETNAESITLLNDQLASAQPSSLQDQISRLKD